MTTIATKTNEGGASLPPSDDAKRLSALTIGLLAGIAGLAVATMYYSQPMLALMAQGMGSSESRISLVPMLTQFGYALGILFLAPLGDRFDRRQIILIKSVILCLALLACALTPTLVILLVASLMIGLSATLAQDVVSASATLAPDVSRGKVVGTVMTGVLFGILLSRVISGLVAECLGWRVMFGIAAGSIALVTVATWRKVPRIETTTKLAYSALMATLWALWKKYPALRRATFAQGLLSIGFSAFWSTLALLLHGEPFHLGSAAAGAFGLAGAASALAAPLVGRMSDLRGPGVVTRIGTGVAALSFGLMFLLPWLSPHAQLVLLGVSVLGFDLGVQVSLIAHQTIIYSMDPGARSRLNAVLFVGMFLGMAIGAGLSGLLFGYCGWMAVTVLTFVVSATAFLLRLLPIATARE